MRLACRGGRGAGNVARWGGFYTQPLPLAVEWHVSGFSNFDGSSQISCGPIAPQPMISGPRSATSVVDGATIEPRIRISRPEEGRGRCAGSRASDLRKGFSQCMQRPSARATSNVISPHQERAEPSGHRPYRCGVKSALRREPEAAGNLLGALFGNVTEPQAVRGRSSRKRPSLADIRRHRDWRYRALLEADPKGLFENPSIPRVRLKYRLRSKSLNSSASFSIY
jgi:hypothetical protein